MKDEIGGLPNWAELHSTSPRVFNCYLRHLTTDDDEFLVQRVFNLYSSKQIRTMLDPFHGQ